MPVLYVYGAQDAMIPAAALHPDQTPVTVAQRARDALPDLVVRELPDAGHTPHHDAPEAFDSHLRAFLDAH